MKEKGGLAQRTPQCGPQISENAEEAGVQKRGRRWALTLAKRSHEGIGNAKVRNKASKMAGRKEYSSGVWRPRRFGPGFKGTRLPEGGTNWCLVSKEIRDR